MAIAIPTGMGAWQVADCSSGVYVDGGGATYDYKGVVDAYGEYFGDPWEYPACDMPGIKFMPNYSDADLLQGTGGAVNTKGGLPETLETVIRTTRAGGGGVPTPTQRSGQGQGTGTPATGTPGVQTQAQAQRQAQAAQAQSGVLDILKSPYVLLGGAAVLVILLTSGGRR